MIMADVNEGSLKEMEALVGEGVTSFKLFMAYPGVLYSDDGQVLRAMQKGAETGGLIMMHAENGIAIDVLIEQALARGQTDPRYHGIVRHELLEAEATHRAIKLAQVANAPVYIVHLSAREGAGGGREGARRGLQRLRRDLPAVPVPVLRRPRAARASRAPSTSAPPRCGPREHQAALWRGLRTNDLSVVSTDHCPFCFKPQKEMGLGDFSKIPNGLPGVEHRMDLLHQGVVDGHISRRRWIEMACATPGADVRALPAQGHDRAGLGRRRRRLRPERDAGAVGGDAPHERRLLLLRGQGDHRPGARRCCRAAGSSIDDGEYRGAAGHGRFLTARHVPVPA